MTAAFWVQFAGSAVAVIILVALARWARIARTVGSLEEGEARRLMDDEFPERTIDQLWLADDGRAALARSGDLALVIFRLGDGFVGRQLPWSRVPEPDAGYLALSFTDFAAPGFRMALSEIGAQT